MSATDSKRVLTWAVYALEGYDGNNALIFDRILFRPDIGFPVQNELVVNTTSGTKCCIACHTTVGCICSLLSYYDPKQK